MRHIVLLGLFVLLSSSLFGEVVELSPSQTIVDITYFDEKNVTMQISLDKFERTVQRKDRKESHHVKQAYPGLHCYGYGRLAGGAGGSGIYRRIDKKVQYQHRIHSEGYFDSTLRSRPPDQVADIAMDVVNRI